MIFVMDKLTGKRDDACVFHAGERQVKGFLFVSISISFLCECTARKITGGSGFTLVMSAGSGVPAGGQ